MNSCYQPSFLPSSHNADKYWAQHPGMEDQSLSDIIEKHPIGNGLKAFRDRFNPTIPGTSDAIERLDREELQHCIFILLSALHNQPAARLLRSNSGVSVLDEILRLVGFIASNDYDFDLIKPLVKICLADGANDRLIWDQVCVIVAESTSSQQPILSSLQEALRHQNTSSLINSPEIHQEVDKILQREVGSLRVSVPGFCDAFFGSVRDLKKTSEMVLCKCMEGADPLFRDGWTGWPVHAKESDVLAWFCDLIPRLEALASEFNPNAILHRRKLSAQPKTPLLGWTGRRTMDIGFVARDFTYKPNLRDNRFRWSQILVPGEIKANPAADIAPLAWIDLVSYAREVLGAQDGRRFVLGFTLCGSIMRVWEFDRLGAMASDKFDINLDGALQFVTTVLGFLWMEEEKLGFDPTIITSQGGRYIAIERNGQKERIYIDEVMHRSPYISGRATTCWKAHSEEDPQVPLVIKDSWQDTNQEEEGEYLQEAANKGVINVARYYYHETVCIGGVLDDIQSHVRKGLDTPGSLCEDKCNSSGMKRPASEIETGLPLAKRSRLASPTKGNIRHVSNRVHRRVILRDYGKPIYQASSRVALLSALESCIKGHESLYNAGFLHRDISINNLMINESKEPTSSCSAFLIDLDLAIKDKRERPSGSQGKIGTRAFMAIGVLLGEAHSFMHDLESFFWVLFWICIHYDAQGCIGPTRRNAWNATDDDRLAWSKKGEVCDEEDFLKDAKENFTCYYQPLVPWVNRLRRHVFPNGGRWRGLEPELYSTMVKILRDAQKDPAVLAEE